MGGLSAPLIRLLTLFGLMGVGILLKSKSYPCRSVTIATFDWRRPGKPELGVLSVKACHLSIIGANRGHFPLEKLTSAVGPPSQLLSDPGKKKGALFFGKTILVGRPHKNNGKRIGATERLSPA